MNLAPAAISRVAAAREMVRVAIAERGAYIAAQRLDPGIWNPAANWDRSQPFYADAQWLIDGGDPWELRPRSKQFTGRSLPSSESPPDVLVLAQYRRFREILPPSLRISPPSLMGESGWLMHDVIVNYDTMAYWERLAILYQVGLLDRQSPHCIKPGMRILEIGGGYGGLAYFLREAVGELDYTIVDLPESLIYSSMYLSACFEDGFRFVPNYRFRDLQAEHFDLAINTLSMSEMSELQVREYCARLPEMARLFFEQNHDCRYIGLGNAEDIVTQYFPYRIRVRNEDGHNGLIQGFANLWSSAPLPSDMDRIIPGLLTSTAITEVTQTNGYRLFLYFGIVCAVPAAKVDLKVDLTQIPGAQCFESLAAAKAQLTTPPAPI